MTRKPTCPPRPIVILSYARTPMGASRARSPAPARPSSAPPRSRAAVERAGVDRRGDRADLHGLRAARRPRPGAGAPGGAQGAGCAIMSRRPRSTRCAARACRRRSWPPTRIAAGSADIDRRRRHGEHDQRALSPDQAPRRRPHRPRHDLSTICSSTASRTPMSPAALMGTLRRGDAPRLSVHPRGAGRLCDRLADPRPGGAAAAAGSTARSSPVEVAGRKGADHRRQGRAAAEGRRLPRSRP